MIEPDGRGHDLLQNWGRYRRGGEREGLPNLIEGHWSEPLDKAKDTEPEYIIEIDRVLAEFHHSGLKATVNMVKRRYLAEEAYWDIAEKLKRTEGFVRLTLRGVCGIVEQRVIG